MPRSSTRTTSRRTPRRKHDPAPSPAPSAAPAIPDPAKRRLRVFAFDPSIATQFQFAAINTATIQVPWEPPPSAENLDNYAGKRPLTLGPIGDYLEVIDHDPGSGCFYEPVDLNDPRLLAQDGLSPDEANPQFHQQMCYAVAMRVINAFEDALGRRVLWSPREFDPQARRSWADQFVRRLRIYPHALREANAYYSPQIKALLFGYFQAGQRDPVNLPGATVFTCLSHDIIAHETTHAILDGVHPLYLEASNPDVRAFHEAFADIVALFHHFSIPESLEHQIAQTRGHLRTQNLLCELAQQFGKAVSKRGALRSAIGSEPDPSALEREISPHTRGSILVAAVFDAFLMIYENRAEPIVRLATSGTGELPPGRISELLVRELSAQASTSARHVLRMCIRALDYCPPVDLTFGEYLRALLTADMDMYPSDENAYRVAFVDAFRKRGIYPGGARSLMVRSVAWQPFIAGLPGMDFFKNGLVQEPDDADFVDEQERVNFKKQDKPMDPERDFAPGVDRFMQFIRAQTYARRLVREWVPALHDRPEIASLLGLALGVSAPKSVRRRHDGRTEDAVPSIRIRSVRPARRVHQDGRTVIDLVVEMTQDRYGYTDAQRQSDADRNGPERDAGGKAINYDFIMRGGCTLLIDMERGQCRYCVQKDILSQDRLDELRRWREGGADVGAKTDLRITEPFATLHRHG
ncbi:MAG: hypothetical protein IT432_01190 [Phycisphaerales bacterium]|nr:hypothetical protein [Phycisphaerales bacterium]